MGVVMLLFSCKGINKMVINERADHRHFFSISNRIDLAYAMETIIGV